MTKNQITEWARKADLWLTSDERIAAVERFAALVAAAEREACAQFLESTQLGSLPNDTALHYARLLKGFAEGIRARGNT